MPVDMLISDVMCKELTGLEMPGNDDKMLKTF